MGFMILATGGARFRIVILRTIGAVNVLVSVIVLKRMRVHNGTGWQIGFLKMLFGQA